LASPPQLITAQLITPASNELEPEDEMGIVDSVLGEGMQSR